MFTIEDDKQSQNESFDGQQSIEDLEKDDGHETLFEEAAEAEAGELNEPPQNRVSQGSPAWPPGPPDSPGGLPPDGGLKAWLQVAAGFMLFFNTWGLLNTFGVYQTYYESGGLFQASSSNISWIGSIQAFCLLVVGFVTGPLFDKGHLRLLLVVGSFGIVFGHMMLSLCHTYWQVLLAQGFVIGLGAGCLFVPAVAILPTYFKNKLGLVVGLAASGSSMGGTSLHFPLCFAPSTI
jgi:hypothetical protein